VADPELQRFARQLAALSVFGQNEVLSALNDIMPQEALLRRLVDAGVLEVVVVGGGFDRTTTYRAARPPCEHQWVIPWGPGHYRTAVSAATVKLICMNGCKGERRIPNLFTPLVDPDDE
jgi:hypothetical protein